MSDLSLANVLDRIKRDTVQTLISYCGYLLVIFRTEEVKVPEQAQKSVKDGTLGVYLGFDMIPDLVLGDGAFRGTMSFEGASTVLEVPWSQVTAIAVPIGRPASSHIPIATFAPYDTPAVAPKPKPDLRLV